MILRVLCATAVILCLAFPQGCSLLPDDGSGTINTGECTGGPVTLSIPAEVFCDVTSIAATISGPDMTTIDITIDKDNPSATLTIPSGPDRSLVVNIYTADNPTTPFFTSSTIIFCVSDEEPVTVTVDVAKKNRAPKVGDIIPSGGVLTPGTPIALSVSASDPDLCDTVQSYNWSTTFGNIVGNGSSAIWIPQCPGRQSCEAIVTVTAHDGRQGTITAQATYQIAAANNSPTVTLTGVERFCTWDLTATGSDPDGDVLTYTWSILPDGDGIGALIPGDTANTVVWDDCKDTNNRNTDVVQVVVDDGHGGSASATYTIIMNNTDSRQAGSK